MEFLKNLLSEKTLKTLTDLLGEEVVKSINEKTKDFKIDVAEEKFIPKNKFDEVNNQLKDVKNQVSERDKQIASLGEKAKGNEELTKQIENLKTENAKKDSEYQTKLLAREKDYAIDTFLATQKSKNLKSVKANLDLEKVNYKDGKLEGLDEQIKALKESDPYLFDIDNSKDKGGKSTYGSGTGSNDEYSEFRKLR